MTTSNTTTETPESSKLLDIDLYITPPSTPHAEILLAHIKKNAKKKKTFPKVSDSGPIKEKLIEQKIHKVVISVQTAKLQTLPGKRKSPIYLHQPPGIPSEPKQNPKTQTQSRFYSSHRHAKQNPGL